MQLFRGCNIIVLIGFRKSIYKNKAPFSAERGTMSESYVECLVKQKNSMAAVLLKWVLIVAAVLFGILGLMGAFIPLIIAVVLGVCAYIVALRSDLEYEYLYLDKEITIDKIMRQTKRKKVATLEVERMEIIAPFHSHRIDSYRNRQFKTVDYSIGEEKKPDLRYVMYYNGEKRIILSPSPELLKAIHAVAPRKVFTD